MSEPQIHLDGRTLEGGGQLLRLAVGLSAITGTALNISNIRGNRSGGGGLKQQHLTAVQWLASMCGAELKGAERKSKELSFQPRRRTTDEPVAADGSRHYSINIGTPGAVTLVFQAILPFLLFHDAARGRLNPDGFEDGPAPIRVTIAGGTNVTNSPSYDYVEQVLLPMLSLAGLPPIEAALNKRGWSTGRAEMGSVTFTVTPLAPGTCIPAFRLVNRGTVLRIQATILAPRQAEKDLQRELRLALKNTLPNVKNVEATFEDSRHQNRLYVLLVATTAYGVKLGRDCLYDRRITSYSRAAVVMAREAVDGLAEEIEHGGCVDTWMRDQLVVFQALSGGTEMPGENHESISGAPNTCRSTAEGQPEEEPENHRAQVFAGRDRRGHDIEMSLHAQTAWWVCEMLLGVNRQSTDGMDGCEGVGLVVGEELAKAAEAAADGSVSEEIEVERLKDMLENRLGLGN